MGIGDEDVVSVFVSVDRHFSGRGFVFQCTSKYAVMVRIRSSRCT